MLTEKQKTFLFGMRGLLRKSKDPNAKAKITMLDCIIDGFAALDDMSIDDIKAVTKKILNDNKIPGGDRR